MYDVNTSKSHRLPRQFFERLYEDIPALLDLTNFLAMMSDENSEYKEQYELILRVTNNLRRQRMSHRGNEE